MDLLPGLPSSTAPTEKNCRAFGEIKSPVFLRSILFLPEDLHRQSRLCCDKAKLQIITWVLQEAALMLRPSTTLSLFKDFKGLSPC